MDDEQERLLALAGIVAAPSGVIGALSTVSQVVNRATAPRRRAMYVAAAVLFVTGGGLGYFVGYEDLVDYDAPMFSKALKDPQNWHSYATSLRQCVLQSKVVEVIRRSEALRHPGAVSKELTQVEKNIDMCEKLIAWATAPRPNNALEPSAPMKQ